MPQTTLLGIAEKPERRRSALRAALESEAKLLRKLRRSHPRSWCVQAIRSAKFSTKPQQEITISRSSARGAKERADLYWRLENAPTK